MIMWRRLIGRKITRINRDEIMQLVLRAIAPLLPPFKTDRMAINCHHNYVQQEFHFGANVGYAQGAISAQAGQLGIIPGSMGAKSFIVRGKGNSDSFCSCSHGAGCKHSRTAARHLFSQKDLIEQTRHVECRKDKAVLMKFPPPTRI